MKLQILQSMSFGCPFFLRKGVNISFSDCFYFFFSFGIDFLLKATSRFKEKPLIVSFIASVTYSSSIVLKHLL